jgi:hypothetical protein
MTNTEIENSRICPDKLVCQSYYRTDMSIDGFSDIEERPVDCDSDCPGPSIEVHSSIIRRIGNKLLPGMVDPTCQVPVCGKRRLSSEDGEGVIVG